MQIEFGNDVFSRDGTKLGTVAGLVMDAQNERVQALVIGEGLFGQDQRLVNISAVTSSGNGRVELETTDAEADNLPQFVRTEYVERPRGGQSGLQDDALIMPAGGVGGPIFYDSSLTATGYGSYGGSDSFFDTAPLNPPVVETRSNLSEEDVVLRKGTDVVGSDGKKIGTVDDILLDDDGRVTGFIVSAGFLFHHDLSIPASAVSEYDDDRVRLNITSDAAEGNRRG